jgi:hypothetical protein
MVIDFGFVTVGAGVVGGGGGALVVVEGVVEGVNFGSDVLAVVTGWSSAESDDGPLPPSASSSQKMPNFQGGSESCICPFSTMHNHGSVAWCALALGWPLAQLNSVMRVPSFQPHCLVFPSQYAPSQIVFFGHFLDILPAAWAASMAAMSARC